MCGRFVFFDVDKVNKRFDLNIDIKLNLNPSYNIFPNKEFPVIYRKSTNTIELMKWGLVPFWAKEFNVKNQMINARSETLLEKPSFRNLIKNKRCMIPSNGFYEWKKISDKKIPYFISLKDHELFSFAGLYDIWVDSSGKEYKTFTIITTESNSLMSEIHNRMPVILKQEYEEIWLDENILKIEMLLDIFKPYNSSNMDVYQISNFVNNPTNDYKELINPLN
jgi:putative SOS response-associated peptidase YedK